METANECSTPVIMFALPQERTPFTRRARKLSSAINTVVSGSGSRRAADCAESMCRQTLAPKCLIISGFAGALTNMCAGDLIAPHTVVSNRGRKHSFKPDTNLLNALHSISSTKSSVKSGILASSNRVLLSHTEKTAFLNQLGRSADAVDMETAAAAEVAENYHIPWVSIRVITDELGDTMPLDFNELADCDEQIQISSIIRAVISKPLALPGIINLGRNSVRAAQSLAACLISFVEVIGSRPK